MTYPYSFSKANDFPYGKVDNDSLRSSILEAPISKALDSIGSAGDAYTIEFLEALTNSSGTWKGVWETGTTYYADDVVYHLGVSYTCILESNSNEPPNETYWTVLAGEYAALVYVVRQHSGEPTPSTDVIEVQTVMGASLPVSGHGTGGWFPSPDENPMVPGQGQVLGLLHDGDGATRFRGPVFTDEGSFRDDFGDDVLEIDLTGTATFTKDSVNVDGAGTAFFEEINKDWYIRLSTDSQLKAVGISRIDSDTGLVLNEGYEGTSGSGTAVASRWVVAKTNGTVEVADSKVELKPSTTSGNNCGIFRGGDYLPAALAFTASLSQRVANQEASFGFSDTVMSGEYSDMAGVLWEGTDNTKVTLITSCQGHTEESEVQLPFGLNTSDNLSYRIEVSTNKVSLFVGSESGENPAFLKEHHKHIPRPYQEMYYGGAIWNTGTVASATTFAIDTVFFSNHNVVQIANSSKGDFLTVQTTSDSLISAYISKKEGPKVTMISPNWALKETWKDGATRVVEEVAGDSGDHTTYQLDNTYVIDNYHGKLDFEDYLIDGGGYSYRVVVKVNDVAKTEQDPHYGTGGDYTINYAAGTITFLSALQAEDVVKVTYHYAVSSLFLVKPITGKNLIVDSVEVQCTSDTIVNDSFVFQPYGYVEAFAPELMGPPYNLPLHYLIPLGDPLVYKTLDNIIADSNKSYVAYPAFGGQNWRALKKDTLVFSWDYPVGSTVLRSAYGMELRITLAHDAPCGGTFVKATLYATSENA